MALSRGIPCATVIGGGYDDDIDVLGRRHSIIHRAAIKVNEKNLTRLYSLDLVGVQVVWDKAKRCVRSVFRCFSFTRGKEALCISSHNVNKLLTSRISGLLACVGWRSKRFFKQFERERTKQRRVKNRLPRLPARYRGFACFLSAFKLLKNSQATRAMKLPELTRKSFFAVVQVKKREKTPWDAENFPEIIKTRSRLV